MALTLRSTKGSALTHAEVDANFSGLADGSLFSTDSTFTPSITFATPGNLSVTYSTRAGFHTKIGNKVFVELDIVTSAFTHTTASGEFRISGLPFTPASTSMRFGGGGLTCWQGITKANYTAMGILVTPTNSYATILASGSGVATASLLVADVPSGGSVVITAAFFYTTT